MFDIIIKLLYPDILDSQYGIQDNSDGNGPFIASWSYPNAPQPSLATLAQYDAQAADFLGLKQFADMGTAYLAATDYKSIRIAEGYALDDNTKTLREHARASIRAYNAFKLTPTVGN